MRIPFWIFLVSISLSCEAQKEPDPSLRKIISQAGKIDGVKSLLIKENDRLLIEEYFGSTKSNDLHHVRSVTKSIIGILVGNAVDQGHISSIDQSIGDYLKEFPGFREEHRAITIRHLLTMSSGIKWDESDVSEFNRWVVSADPVKYVLDRQLKKKPGTHFEYNSGTTHLLSVILTKATGMSTQDFARQFLFAPLGIETFRWQKITGYYNGAAGLELRPADMLKIGQMMANEGMYQGKRIVSENWVLDSAKPQIMAAPEQGYSFLWWVETQMKNNMLASGFAGQSIGVILDRDAVLVTTCQWTNLGKGGATRQSEEIGRLMNGIVLPYFIEKWENR